MSDKEILDKMSKNNLSTLLKEGKLHEFLKLARPVLEPGTYDSKAVNALVGIWFITHKT